MTAKANVSVVSLIDVIPEDTADLEILKPGRTEGTGWFITIAGPGHPQTIALNDDERKRGVRRAQQIESAQINGRKWKGEDEDADEVRRRNVERVVRRIVSWTPVDIGAGPVEFAPDTATALFLNPRMDWVVVQILEFISDERSFTPRSAKP